MATETMTTFFAVLAVVGLLVVAAAVVFGVLGLFGRQPGWWTALRRDLAPVALWLGAAVASTATLGSLYLSEVANFPPCILCWYQRIAMYPLAVVLAVAAIRRDTQVRWYVIPVAGIGMGISMYHYLLERFPASVASVCTDDVPCSVVWVWEFGFLSIPAMAGIGFALIITLVVLSTPPATFRVARDAAEAPSSGRIGPQLVDELADEVGAAADNTDAGSQHRH